MAPPASRARPRNSSPDKKSLNRLATKASVATVPRRTKVARALFTPVAREAIAGIEDGLDVFGFTKGQFSFVDLIDAVLGFAGPSAVTVCTWTAAAADASFLGSWAKQGRIKEFRLLIDYSFLNRTGGHEAVDEVQRHFGTDAVRVTRTHAKWALVSGEVEEFALLTSMNLNSNPRFEYFHITRDSGVVEMLNNLATEIWSGPNLADAVKMRPQEHKNIFAALWGADQGQTLPIADSDFDFCVSDYDPDLGL